jgi:hypothetical protein
MKVQSSTKIQSHDLIGLIKKMQEGCIANVINGIANSASVAQLKTGQVRIKNNFDH